MLRTARGWLIPVLVVLVWEIGSRAGALPLDSLSRPSMIVSAGVEGFTDASIFAATWQTLEAALLGFAIAVGIGVPLGIVLGIFPRMDSMIGPTIDALRPVPSVALIPIALLVFGFGLRLEASVVAFASVWPVLLMTISAVKSIEPCLLEVASTMEVTPAARVWKFILPAAMARIVIGLRLALGIALIVAVTVEIVLNPRGLGHSMMSAQQALRSDIMYAQLFWLGLIGWGLNILTLKAVRAFPGVEEGRTS